LKETVERFSNRVENYVKYRPGYPKEILPLFRDEMYLQIDSTIADIGAGTGISSKIFLENGNTVFGVEPNANMRRAAREFLKDFLKFKAIDGTSEQTNLPEESVDFAIAAQAFHWFDAEKSHGEFKRILKPEGFTAVIWNERQLDSTPFLREYEQLLSDFGTDYAQVRHDNFSEEILRYFFKTDMRRAVFANVQTIDFEGLKGRMMSASYIPDETSEVFPEMIKQLAALFAGHAENGKIQILYDTKIYFGRI
jgi:ubiquinone/menaquinone biosynthesis C-methylase UbiE